MLIVAGIIATAAGTELLIAEPHDPQIGVGLAIVVGGPALFLLGASLFRWMTTGGVDVERIAAAVVILGLIPLASHVSALVLAVIVTGVLSALSLWELRASAPPSRVSRHQVVGV